MTIKFFLSVVVLYTLSMHSRDNNLFDKNGLKKLRHDTEWKLFGLQNVAIPRRDSWLVKQSALATGRATEMEWQNLERLTCLAKTPNEKIQQYIDACTDADAQAMYAFVTQAQDRDDLVVKQNDRDKDTLTEQVALKRLFENSIFTNVVVPERKNLKNTRLNVADSVEIPKADILAEAQS